MLKYPGQIKNRVWDICAILKLIVDEAVMSGAALVVLVTAVARVKSVRVLKIAPVLIGKFCLTTGLKVINSSEFVCVCSGSGKM
jgi:hypothetical protein